ncbi:hypothetical protein Kisp01_27620 [Kineosporia sp. NBRC 101677]|uniref:hypothetical protein n=1 Tax=Kineosporia sp. NBRC 101677 TaxID=3032197 RepID=UPI0024A155E2|nr:hypothetical protein [Kineosporia sp. NBRC 101677]GLY15747.1 hypothetical protein Kisp01_27620 [Kineosporia sp. NBRC 101677]
MAGAADVFGRDLVTTVADISGTSITLADPAGAAVANVPMTNGSWDDFLMGNTGGGNNGSARLTWIGGSIGGEASLGRVRYAVNLAACSGDVTLMGSTAYQVVYDPQRVGHILCGSVPLRQPPTGYAEYFRGSQLAPRSILAGTEFPRTVVASPPGRDLVLGLRPQDDVGSGGFGNVEIRLGDASQSVLASVRSDGRFTAKRYLLGDQGQLTGATPDVSAGNRFILAHASPTTVTQFAGAADGQVIFLRASCGNTTIPHCTNIVNKSGANDVLAQGATCQYMWDQSALRWFEY